MNEASSIEMFPEYRTLVASLEKPMFKICDELKPGFENQDYGIIVGDDTSGRVPTLAVKGVSDYISEKVGAEKVPTVFLQAGTKVNDEDIVEQLKARVLPSKDKLGGKKALIVTEYIQSGKSINRLMNIFSTHGVSFDVVSISVSSELDLAKLNMPEGSKLVLGEITPYSQSFWKRPELSGLSRKVDSSASVQRIKDNPYVRDRVVRVRQDLPLLVKNVTDHIYLKDSIAA